jgi:hypothetical protein
LFGAVAAYTYFDVVIMDAGGGMGFVEITGRNS